MSNPQVQIDIQDDIIESRLLAEPSKPSRIEIPVEPTIPASLLSPDSHEHTLIEEPEIFKFSWNATDNNNKEFKYDKKSCCLKVANLYEKCPLLLRYVLYSLTGTAIFMIPGLISYFLYLESRDVYFVKMKPKSDAHGVNFSLDGVPMFVWSV